MKAVKVNDPRLTQSSGFQVEEKWGMKRKKEINEGKETCAGTINGTVGEPVLRSEGAFCGVCFPVVEYQEVRRHCLC